MNACLTSLQPPVHAKCCAVLIHRVVRVAKRGGKVHAQVGLVPVARVAISIHQEEVLGIHSELLSHCEICRGEETPSILGSLVALNENALWDAAVVLARLGDVHAVILEVVVKDQLANTMVLDAALSDGFFEVAIEAQDLTQHRGGMKQRGKQGNLRSVTLHVMQTLCTLRSFSTH